MTKNIMPVFVIFMLFVLTTNVNAKESHDLLLYGVNIIDVETGNITPNGFLAIDDDAITFIGDDSVADEHAGLTEIELVGKYIIPGLWDMHIHLEGKDLADDNKALLPLYIAYGITTVRDMASDLGEQVLAWRGEIARNEFLGPQIFTAGRKLEGIGSIWPGDLEIANEQDLDRMLDKIDNYNVDLVKITDNALGGDLFLESVKASHARGYIVSGHIPYDLTINELADAGMSSIEHASYLIRLGSDENKNVDLVKAGTVTNSQVQSNYLVDFDQDQANEAYLELAKKNVAVCPTLIGSNKLTYFNPDKEEKQPFRQYLTDLYVSKYQWRIDRMSGDTLEDKARKIKTYELIASQLPHIQKAGMLIIAGSDSAPVNTFVYPALALHEELIYFQNAGLTPLEILQSATINGAKFMKRTETLGGLNVGMNADIVVLNSNPLEDIKATQDIYAVVNNGVFFDRSALDFILENARETSIKLNDGRQ